MKFKSIEDQLYVIKRGVDEILPESQLVEKIEKSLSTNIPLNIKLGCDPSRPDLHLGHSVVLKKYEAGIVLKGSEVKSIRENKATIKESYIRVKDDEIFIIGMNISKYSHEGYSTHDPSREKKLLIHKREILAI